MARVRPQPPRESQLRDILLHSQKGERFRDFLLYCAIGISLALAAIFIGVHQAKVHQPATAITKWISFAFMTAFVFGYVVRNSRDLWKHGKFWWVLALLATVHIAWGLAVLRRVYAAPLIDLAVIAVPEYYVLIRCLDRFTH